ncbi:putative glycosyltransferase [Synechococcus sp. Minos11]|uniref:glycosyltransferase n=1 Tax=Synechococcus sp. Minos11 TaxID=221341 RepID=UPI0016466CC6|nr:glycosyltransferase [Synechococcus sp. Minos11]QNJ07660.1 putative glycosyltransferase [Synechococcus sp. Minos11]
MAARFWLYSHNFTHSGAPLVLAAIARELAVAGLRKQLRIVSWGGLHDQRHSTLQHQLADEGIHCQVLNPDQSPPKIKPGDRLLLNTVALPDAVMRQALVWLSAGKLQRLDWYAHESDPKIWLQSNDTRRLIVEALSSGRLQMRVPSFRVMLAYQKWLEFEGAELDVLCPAISPTSMIEARQPIGKGHFNNLRLLLVGAVGSGNKGHLWLLRLLESALKEIPNDAVEMRAIRLQFAGLETANYAALTRVVIRQAEELLGDQFAWHPASSKEQIFQDMQRSNLLVNCSLKEAFSCVCSEAMALGLPLIRIQNGGFEEQLMPEETGFDLGCPSPEISPEQVQLINRLRDPLACPESKLFKMATAARARGRQFAAISYQDWLL